MEPDFISPAIFKKPLTKWQKFVQAFNVFSGETQSNTQSEQVNTENNKKKWQKSIEKEIDLLIDLSNTALILKFMQSGYVFTDKQINKILSENEDFWNGTDPIAQQFLQYFKQRPPIIVEFMDYQQRSFNDEIKSAVSGLNKNYPLTASDSVQKHGKSLNNKIQKNAFLMQKFDFVFQDDLGHVREKLEIFRNTAVLIKKHSHWNDYLFSKLNTYNTQCLDILEQKYLNFSEHMASTLSKTQAVYGNIAKTIHHDFTQRIKEKASNLSETIPKPSWQLTQKLQNTINQIVPDDLDKIQRLDFDKMVQKRIPQIFEDYLGISDEYKAKLKTVDNKTPDDLLLDSIQEAYSIIVQIYDTQQKNKLNSMNVTNKYLKNKNI